MCPVLAVPRCRSNITEPQFADAAPQETGLRVHVGRKERVDDRYLVGEHYLEEEGGEAETQVFPKQVSEFSKQKQTCHIFK